MRKPTFRTTALCLLALTLNSQSAFAEKSDQSASETPLFPKANCDVDKASLTLKEKLASTSKPVWDGDLPWPDILGFWLSESRNSYITVEVRAVENAKYGVIHVSFRSICDNALQAHGARPIAEADFNKKSLSLVLRNFALNAESLSSEIKVLESQDNNPDQNPDRQEAAKKELEIKMNDLSREDEAKLRDQFKALKF